MKQIYDDTIKYDMDGVAPAASVMSYKLKSAYLDNARKELVHQMGRVRLSRSTVVVACPDGEWHVKTGGGELCRQVRGKYSSKV